MRWYKREPDKFETDTAGLNPVEYAAYNRLVDNYYIQEKPLRDDDSWLAGLARIPLDTWLSVKDRVLSFFEYRNPEPGKNRLGSWVHGKCERVMASARSKGEVARENGLKGGRPVGSKNKGLKTQKPSNNPTETQPKPNEKLTVLFSSSKRPELDDSPDGESSTRGTRLPADWRPSQDLLDYAKARGLTQPEIEHMVEEFVTFWTVGPGRKKTYTDWPRCFQGRVREIALRKGRKPAWRSQGMAEPARAVEGSGDLLERVGGWGKEDADGTE